MDQRAAEQVGRSVTQILAASDGWYANDLDDGGRAVEALHTLDAYCRVARMARDRDECEPECIFCAIGNFIAYYALGGTSKELYLSEPPHLGITLEGR